MKTLWLALLLAAAQTAAAFEISPQSAWLNGLPQVGRAAAHADAEFNALLPDRFYFANPTAVQPLIDQLLTHMFASLTARTAFCPLAGQSPNDLHGFLGASPATAIALAKMCGPIKLTNDQQRLLNAMKAHMPGEDTHQPSKTYALAVSANTLPPIEGFSAQTGTTLIVVNKNEFNEPHLLRILAHELAISFDQLGPLDPAFDTEDWEFGLNAVFPAANGQIFDTPDNLKDLRCAVRDPAVRYGAAAERAIRFEDAIIAELNLSPQSPPLALHDSCARIIGKRAISISPMAKTVVDETDRGMFREECGVEIQKDALRAQTLVARIQLVADTTLHFRSNGQALNLCQLLTEPHVGPRVAEPRRHSGPRPRIGGW